MMRPSASIFHITAGGATLPAVLRIDGSDGSVVLDLNVIYDPFIDDGS